VSGQGVALPTTALCGDGECEPRIGEEGVWLPVLALGQERVVLSGVRLRVFGRVVLRRRGGLIVAGKERTEAVSREHLVRLVGPKRGGNPLGEMRVSWGWSGFLGRSTRLEKTGRERREFGQKDTGLG
jgi:hypothetical protein